MSRDDTVRQLEHEFGVFIRRVRRVIAMRARAVHPDLQPASYLMLSHLVQNGPMRSSALAETFAIDKGAISRQVQHLTDLGLIERTPDPEDGRASQLTASADGVSRLQDVIRIRRKHLDERLGDWSDDDLADFVSALGRYNASLE